jgi:hypothetical protein
MLIKLTCVDEHKIFVRKLQVLNQKYAHHNFKLDEIRFQVKSSISKYSKFKLIDILSKIEY